MAWRNRATAGLPLSSPAPVCRSWGQEAPRSLRPIHGSASSSSSYSLANSHGPLLASYGITAFRPEELKATCDIHAVRAWVTAWAPERYLGTSLLPPARAVRPGRPPPQTNERETRTVGQKQSSMRNGQTFDRGSLSTRASICPRKAWPATGLFPLV